MVIAQLKFVIMKKVIFTWLLSGMILTVINAQYGVERTGYEGDYFSLEGAIELFKESRSINNFERRLNDEDSWVNNLDLNYDGDIDYIRVEHRNQGDFHAIVLQAILGRRDVQDVAVIEIERTGRRTAVLQIIGDADLYGEEVIAEPYNSAGYSARGDYDFSRGYVNVYHWRAVQRIFDRSYVAYVSPYRWNYYPTYWSPWHQHGWSVYHPRRVRYYNHCHIVYVHRVIHVHNFYRPFRSHSIHVAHRARNQRKTYGSSVAHRSNGKRNSTYRAPVRNTKKSIVAPRNSLGSRTTSSNGRNKTVSPRSNNSANTRVQSRDMNARSKGSTPIVRSRGNENATNRNTGRTRSQNDRNRAERVVQPAVRKEKSRPASETRQRPVQKSQPMKSEQSRSSTTQKRSQSRSEPGRKQQRTQSRTAPRKSQERVSQGRTAPRKTQQRTSQSRKQSSSARSSSGRNSTTVKQSSAPRKSATPKRSAPSRKSNTSKSVRKGKG
jgi:hypothetical protein